MKTRLSISTISYNTPDFLRLKLEELRAAKIITKWYFVEHQPEPDEDEAGKKKHIHLYILPAKQILTDDLCAELLEPDPHNKKPLKCLSFRVTKNFGDWYLYAIHDRPYLASKGQSRKYHYAYDDMQAFDGDELHRDVSEIDLLDSSPYQRMATAITDGVSFQDLVRRGQIPIPQINAFMTAWQLLTHDDVVRNGRGNHEINVDEQTGEVID